MIDAETRQKVAEALRGVTARQRNALLLESVRDAYNGLDLWERKELDGALSPVTDHPAHTITIGQDGAQTLVLSLALAGYLEDK